MLHTLYPVSRFGKSNKTITVPAFGITAITWLGASIILTEFQGSADDPFTLRFPFTAPNESFCLAIRWLDDDGNVVRRKCWEGIGEKLTYPLYNGEVIGTEFALEIWNVEGASTASLAEDTILTTGILVSPSYCCTSESGSVSVAENAELFAEYGYTWETEYYQSFDEI